MTNKTDPPDEFDLLIETPSGWRIGAKGPLGVIAIIVLLILLASVGWLVF